MRELQYGNQEVLGTELQMKKSFLRLGVQWLFVLLLLASRSAGPAIRPIAERRELPRDARRTARRFVRRQGQNRRAAGPERSSERPGCPHSVPGRSSLLPQRRTRRFSSSSRGEEDSPTLDLIDPLTLKGAGSASVDDLTKIGTNNHLRRVLQTTLARFGLSSPDASVRLDAVRDIEQDLDEGNVQLLRER